MKDERRKNQDLRDRTEEFALQVIAMYAVLPKTAAAQILGKQILRSGTSVGANYREASRARSKAEFIAKIGDCLKEIEETEYWLSLIDKTQSFSQDIIKPLLSETSQLIAIFTAIAKKAKGTYEK